MAHGRTVKPPLPPMEALLVDEIPQDPGWQYEPKWDGFRCLAFREGQEVYLQSKAEKSLSRYFPEIVAALRAMAARRFVLDGELVVPISGHLAFDELLQRIHPAASRIQKLSLERPALYIVFDMLQDDKGKSLLELPLEERRERLEVFARRYFPRRGSIRLSPATSRVSQAQKWFRTVGGNLDGIIAKRRDSEYRPGERTAMAKVKRIRSADCVVGGFRYGSHRRVVGSLLLGLYDDAGLLHHVGFTANIPAKERPALTKKLTDIDPAAGFYRLGARRTESMEHEAIQRMAAVSARAGRGSDLRSFLRRPFSPRHQFHALAPGQIPAAMHARPSSLPP